MVELINTDFQEVFLSEEATWQEVVMISKGGGDYHVIGLMEVVCKTVKDIINRCLRMAISFHNMMHGFRAGRGRGTDSLKAKLLQKLTDMREEVLYEIFLDLHKAYDVLDRDRYLEILEGYGADIPPLT